MSIRKHGWTGLSRLVPVGGLWEFADWEVVENFVTEPEFVEYIERCPHTEERDGVPVWPLVAVVKNEAGHNNTGLCLLCAADQVDALRDYVLAQARA